jgi:hypothetical protein
MDSYYNQCVIHVFFHQDHHLESYLCHLKCGCRFVRVETKCDLSINRDLREDIYVDVGVIQD